MAGELGLDNDLLHALVNGVTGKEHISGLNKKEASRVIDELEERANRSRTVMLPDGRKVPLATKKQHLKIKQLVQRLCWEDNQKRLQGFCKKYAGV
ncbi:MAG: phage protein GemA/Gp16 family protein, partial [Desulfotomaculales bacterium]